MSPHLLGLTFLVASLAALVALPLHAQTPTGLGDDWLVARVTLDDPAQLEALEATLDVWDHGRGRDSVLVRLTEEQLLGLEEAGFALEIDLFQTEMVRHPPTVHGPQGGGITGFPCYRTVEETFADLSQLAADHPQLARWVDIGDSWEKSTGAGGYDIQALVIGNMAAPGPKAPFILMAAMHAREYTTAELAARFAERLINGYGNDPDITWILDTTEIHVVAQQNPDGRKRAEGGAFWRKNTNNGFCSNTSGRGIDLNRNSTFLWGGVGSSGSQCADNFRGPSAGSEPETMAIESYMATVFPDQRGATGPAPDDATGLFISLHSFSELVLYPWEGDTAASPNDAQLSTLARKFGFYNGYFACQDALPPAAGTTVDQAYGEYGVAGFTFELGTTFFQGCSTFENTILPDNMPALLFAAKAARRPYQSPTGPEVIDVVATPAMVTAGEPVTLTATADDGRSESNGCGNDPVHTISEVRYKIDELPWQAGTSFAMDAADGSFDSSSEGATATLDTTGLAPGRYLLLVYSEDDNGAQGPPSAAFLEILDGQALFADGFESGDTTLWPGGTS